MISEILVSTPIMFVNVFCIYIIFQQRERELYAYIVTIYSNIPNANTIVWIILKLQSLIFNGLRQSKHYLK